MWSPAYSECERFPVPTYATIFNKPWGPICHQYPPEYPYNYFAYYEFGEIFSYLCSEDGGFLEAEAMAEAAGTLDFEKAALYRDKIKELEKLVETR